MGQLREDDAKAKGVSASAAAGGEAVAALSAPRLRTRAWSASSSPSPITPRASKKAPLVLPTLLPHEHLVGNKDDANDKKLPGPPAAAATGVVAAAGHAPLLGDAKKKAEGVAGSPSTAAAAGVVAPLLGDANKKAKGVAGSPSTAAAAPDPLVRALSGTGGGDSPRNKGVSASAVAGGEGERSSSPHSFNAAPYASHPLVRDATKKKALGSPAATVVGAALPRSPAQATPAPEAAGSKRSCAWSASSSPSPSTPRDSKKAKIRRPTLGLVEHLISSKEDVTEVLRLVKDRGEHWLCIDRDLPLRQVHEVSRAIATTIPNLPPEEWDVLCSKLSEHAAAAARLEVNKSALRSIQAIGKSLELSIRQDTALLG